MVDVDVARLPNSKKTKPLCKAPDLTHEHEDEHPFALGRLEKEREREERVGKNATIRVHRHHQRGIASRDTGVVFVIVVVVSL